MADGISFSMKTDQFTSFIGDRASRMNRAAMWVVREAGRTGRKAAVVAAPILVDKSKQSHRQLQRRKRQGEDVLHAYQSAVPGLLKASIKSTRAMNVGAGSFSIKVGPVGSRVHLYAGKEEERRAYMDAGKAAAEAAAQAIANQAFGKVWR